jgi:serine/threonine protein kinase
VWRFEERALTRLFRTMTEEHDADVTRPRRPPPGEGSSLIDGRYELIASLGEGGMGQVFKAVDRLAEAQDARDPYVAIKVLKAELQEDPTAIKALHREFARARNLRHPSILRIDQFGQDRTTGLHFIVMELLEGCSLDSVIAENRRKRAGQSWAEISGFFSQICAGLECAHEEGIIHSDIKPSNLFITSRGKVKILDFGIAALRPETTDDGRVTRYDPRKLGALTPGYASLEMFEGREAHDSDDIYSFACVTYEWLSGRHPYARATQPGAAVSAPDALLAGPPAPVPTLTRSQNRALAKALALRREDRTQTIKELWRSMAAPGQASRPIAGVVGGWLDGGWLKREGLPSAVLLTFMLLLVMIVLT